MKKFTFLALVALVSAFPAFGQTTTTTVTATPAVTAPSFPASLPISSKGALRSYLIEKAVRGYISVYGDTILPNSSNITYYESEGTSVGKVLNGLNKLYRFDVADPADTVYSWASVLDKDWNQLFYGGVPFNLVKVIDGVYRIPESAAAKLKMVSSPAIDIGDANEVKIVFRDDNGNQWTEYLQVSDGKAYYPNGYTDGSGKGVVILTSNRNGSTTSVAYSLSGEKLPVSNVIGTVAVSLENYQEVNDKGLTGTQQLPIAVTVDVSQTAYQDPPVVRVEVTSVRRITLLAKVVKNGTVVEYPIDAFVRVAGEVGEGSQVFLRQSQSIVIELQPGVYFIHFGKLKSLEYDKPQPPYNGGGKG